MIELTLPEPPSANRYWRSVIHRTKMRAMVFKSKEAKEYCEAVQLVARLNDVVPLTGEVSVTLVWHRAHSGKGDVDNRIKVALDALQGVAFFNDSQVAELHMRRVTIPKAAHLQVRVERIEGQTDSLFEGTA